MLVQLLPLLFPIVPFLLYKKRRIYQKNLPPIVHIPEHEIFSNPREVYERALEQNGPIIGVKRKGRLEYIVDARLTHEVLTNNPSFSFEGGTAFILNLHYFNKTFKSFFTEIDDLVRNVIITRMPLVVEQVFPVFSKHASNLVNELNRGTVEDRGRQYMDALDFIHRSIAEAMALVILGQDFVHDDNLDIIEKVAHDMAVVTGIYQNTSWWGTKFPSAWRIINWIKILCFTIPVYYKTIGLQIWKRTQEEATTLKEFKNSRSRRLHRDSVLDYLVYKNYDSVGRRVPFRGYMRITVLVLGIIFASVHQTASVAVWVLYQLAIHSEYLPSLREELLETKGVDWTAEHAVISYESLQGASRLDSFIREVLRTKGDTLSCCRLTTHDVDLGGYIIPKGSLVLPLASLSHMNTLYHGSNAEIFDGYRWVGTGKQAVTINTTYFPFGHGQWACPGRAFAVAEIKMIVWSILVRARPVLKDGRFTVEDPLNITSVAPKGEMTLIPY